MKTCVKCPKRLRSDYGFDVCQQCRSVCECGSKKDWRAISCRSCGSRRVATEQWQRMRPKMLEVTRAFAATRKGKRIKPPSYCTIDGCTNVAEAHGWCHKHYARWKYSGTTDLTTPPAEERFWANVRKTEGCWWWTGCKNEHGYGLIGIDGRHIRAHRYSYYLAYGEYPMPQGRHTCDNPGCVRPDHIVPGTMQDNMRDKVIRNRQQKGSAVGGAKLTESQVATIKRMLADGVYQKEIAEMYGVNQSVISNIKTGSLWKHVT